MFSVFSLCACIYERHGMERSNKQYDLVESQVRWVSEPRTAMDRMCTDAQLKRSLCNGASWTHSNCSRSNVVISLTPSVMNKLTV